MKFKALGYTSHRSSIPEPLQRMMCCGGKACRSWPVPVIQNGCVIGDNAIINTGSIVDHDCMVGEHVHIAPGAVLSGGVTVGPMTNVGTGATVIQGIRIGEGAVIGAGSVVVDDVPAYAQVAGVPAKEKIP